MAAGEEWRAESAPGPAFSPFPHRSMRSSGECLLQTKQLAVGFRVDRCGPFRSRLPVTPEGTALQRLLERRIELPDIYYRKRASPERVSAKGGIGYKLLMWEGIGKIFQACDGGCRGRQNGPAMARRG